MGTVKKYASCVQGHQASRCGRTRQFLTCVQLILLLEACGGSPALPPDEGFRRIQEHEAAVSLASAKLDAAADCGENRELSEQVCRESRSLCQVAEQLEDADAIERCASSSDACEGARERTANGCATSATP